jgi:hypothetical protein
MITNAAAYATLAELPASAVARCAHGAQVEVEGDDATWTKLRLRLPSGPAIQISHMTEGAERVRHLQGFAGYVMHLANGKMTSHVYSVFDRVLRTRHVIGMTASPGFDEKAITFVRALCKETKSILFLADAVLDDHERALIAPGGEIEPGSEVPRFESALARKGKSDAALGKLGVTVATDLPPIPGDEETILRTPAEIARRAKVVFAAAVHGEEPDSAFTTKFVKDAGLWDETTAEEREFLAKVAPTQQERAQFSWQYEGIAALLWALRRGELGPPTAICDVPALAKAVAHTSVADLEKSEPRSRAEIFDAADLLYRMHWATKGARVRGRPSPAGLEPGVVMERRRALYWLIRHRDAPWDDVCLDT